MTEHDLHRELVKGLASQGHYVKKFPDSAMGLVKAYDLIHAYPGGAFAPVEAKLDKRKRSYGVRDEDTVLRSRDFSGHQLPGLYEIQDSGLGSPVVAAGIAIELPSGKYSRRVWWIPVELLRELPEPFSLKVSDLEQMEGVTELVWLPARGWALPKEEND